MSIIGGNQSYIRWCFKSHAEAGIAFRALHMSDMPSSAQSDYLGKIIHPNPLEIT